MKFGITFNLDAGVLKKDEKIEKSFFGISKTHQTLITINKRSLFYFGTPVHQYTTELSLTFTLLYKKSS